MLRPRLTFRADETARTLFIRWIGQIEGGEVVAGLMSYLVLLDRVWEYDMAIDLLRFDGHLHPVDVDTLSLSWQNLVQGRDAGRRTAIISHDPLLQARLNGTRAAFPKRELAMFAEVAPAMAWIGARQGQAVRKALCRLA